MNEQFLQHSMHMGQLNYYEDPLKRTTKDRTDTQSTHPKTPSDSYCASAKIKSKSIVD